MFDKVLIKYNDIPQHASSSTLIPQHAFLIKLREAPNAPIILINNDFSMRVIILFLVLSRNYEETGVLYNFILCIRNTIKAEGVVGLGNFACIPLLSLSS